METLARLESKVQRVCLLHVIKNMKKNENSFVSGLLCSLSIFFFPFKEISNSSRQIDSLPSIFKQSYSKKFKITESPQINFTTSKASYFMHQINPFSQPSSKPQSQTQHPSRSSFSLIIPSNRRKSTSDDNYITITTIMEFLQFGEDSQDQPQVTKESPLLHPPLQPCRFIEDLNKKQNICYPYIDDENIYIKLYEIFRVKSLDDRTLKEEPVMNKVQSFDEKLIEKKGVENLDPEQKVAKPKPNMRKRITIEKKLSEHAPLNGPGVIKLKDGKVVFGTWKDGQSVGQVKIMYPSGNIYIGEVKHYIRNGKGLFCYNNGYKYDGQFKDGKFQGYGEITNEFGEVVSKGIWAAGQLAQSII